MCITEFDEELYEQTIKDEGREEGLAEGRAEGRAEGEDNMGLLISTLLSQKRIDDAMRVSEDKAFRKAMLKELGIEQ